MRPFVLLLSVTLWSACTPISPIPLSLSGRVEGYPWRTQATAAEVIDRATVSLLDPVTQDAQGSGLTDPAGAFHLEFDSSFQPIEGSTWLLDVYKRLPVGNVDTGRPILFFRTVVSRTNGSWRSISNGSANPNDPIRINARTTAAALLAERFGVPLSEAIGAVSGATLTGFGGIATAELEAEKLRIDADLAANSDPIANRLAEAQSSLQVARSHPAVAVVNDHVYVLGGASNAAERLASGQSQWNTLPSMPVTMDRPRAAVVNSHIYVLGASGTTDVLDFDPTTENWASEFNRPHDFEDQAVVSDGTAIYTIGGSNGATSQNNLDKLVPGAGWQALSPLAAGQERQAAAAAHFDGYIYLFGGEQGTSPPAATGSVLRYHIATDSWSSYGQMPTARAGAQTLIHGHYIYVIGGYTRNGLGERAASDAVELFDPVVATSAGWTIRQSLPPALLDVSAIALTHLGQTNGRFLQIGGLLSGTPLPTVRQSRLEDL